MGVNIVTFGAKFMKRTSAISLEFFSTIPTKTKPVTEVKIEESGKNTPYRMSDDIIYRLQLSILTFIIYYVISYYNRTNN